MRRDEEAPQADSNWGHDGQYPRPSGNQDDTRAGTVQCSWF